MALCKNWEQALRGLRLRHLYFDTDSHSDMIQWAIRSRPAVRSLCLSGELRPAAAALQQLQQVLRSVDHQASTS